MIRGTRLLPTMLSGSGSSNVTCMFYTVMYYLDGWKPVRVRHEQEGYFDIVANKE